MSQTSVEGNTWFARFPEEQELKQQLGGPQLPQRSRPQKPTKIGEAVAQEAPLAKSSSSSRRQSAARSQQLEVPTGLPERRLASDRRARNRACRLVVRLAQRLRVGTDCSGLEAPMLALRRSPRNSSKHLNKKLAPWSPGVPFEIARVGSRTLT